MKRMWELHEMAECIEPEVHEETDKETADEAYEKGFTDGYEKAIADWKDRSSRRGYRERN